VTVVGFIASSFDLIHPGYIRLLADAKTVCDFLVCAVHEDPSLERQHKNRPIMSVTERVEIVAAIKYVDRVVTYQTENDLVKLLEEISPNVMVIGSEYRDTEVTGGKLPGIKIHWHDRNHKWSSTRVRATVVSRWFDCEKAVYP
jgi:glycerol-3-phosphate cytidylyltransferase